MKVQFKTDKPKLLDCYCCEGGAAKGYNDAGFEVVGIDIVDRVNYPYQFIKGDVLELLKDKELVEQFDVIHASPPCQHYSRLKYLNDDIEAWEKKHVDLINPTRELLCKIGKPYVIENVVGAPLICPIKLSGSQFKGMYTQRPRLFESNVFIQRPIEPVKKLGTSRLGTISETGAVSICGRQPLQGLNEEQTKLYYMIALGGDCQWMSLEGLTQCIPPCYTEFIGKQIIDSLYKPNEDYNNVQIEQYIREILSSKEFLNMVVNYVKESEVIA